MSKLWLVIAVFIVSTIAPIRLLTAPSRSGGISFLPLKRFVRRDT
jgi:hypothetical protein